MAKFAPLRRNVNIILVVMFLLLLAGIISNVTLNRTHMDNPSHQVQPPENPEAVFYCCDTTKTPHVLAPVYDPSKTCPAGQSKIVGSESAARTQCATSSVKVAGCEIGSTISTTAGNIKTMTGQCVTNVDKDKVFTPMSSCPAEACTQNWTCDPTQGMTLVNPDDGYSECGSGELPYISDPSDPTSKTCFVPAADTTPSNYAPSNFMELSTLSANCVAQYRCTGSGTSSNKCQTIYGKTGAGTSSCTTSGTNASCPGPAPDPTKKWYWQGNTAQTCELLTPGSTGATGTAYDTQDACMGANCALLSAGGTYCKTAGVCVKQGDLCCADTTKDNGKLSTCYSCENGTTTAKFDTKCFECGTNGVVPINMGCKDVCVPSVGPQSLESSCTAMGGMWSEDTPTGNMITHDKDGCWNGCTMCQNKIGSFLPPTGSGFQNYLGIGTCASKGAMKSKYDDTTAAISTFRQIIDGATVTGIGPATDQTTPVTAAAFYAWMDKVNTWGGPSASAIAETLMLCPNQAASGGDPKDTFKDMDPENQTYYYKKLSENVSWWDAAMKTPTPTTGWSESKADSMSIPTFAVGLGANTTYWPLNQEVAAALYAGPGGVSPFDAQNRDGWMPYWSETNYDGSPYTGADGPCNYCAEQAPQCPAVSGAASAPASSPAAPSSDIKKAVVGVASPCLAGDVMAGPAGATEVPMPMAAPARRILYKGESHRIAPGQMLVKAGPVTNMVASQSLKAFTKSNPGFKDMLKLKADSNSVSPYCTIADMMAAVGTNLFAGLNIQNVSGSNIFVQCEDFASTTTLQYTIKPQSDIAITCSAAIAANEVPGQYCPGAHTGKFVVYDSSKNVIASFDSLVGIVDVALAPGLIPQPPSLSCGRELGSLPWMAGSAAVTTGSLLLLVGANSYIAGRYNTFLGQDGVPPKMATNAMLLDNAKGKGILVNNGALWSVFMFGLLVTGIFLLFFGVEQGWWLSDLKISCKECASRPAMQGWAPTDPSHESEEDGSAWGKSWTQSLRSVACRAFGKFCDCRSAKLQNSCLIANKVTGKKQEWDQSRANVESTHKCACCGEGECYDCSLINSATNQYCDLSGCKM